ncbi:MAG: hypothetical protein Hyperionvirus26_8 [Hyperionvirus sp.]|uniref:Uncharacterized protein n=1 Tax=Hyperionvirus sp. TaxID=2487770 RepID=A0A3G5AEY9_9VIRU|nr:MAG: hypothetical protein Hyperionvirus26_8 [Hyperionvirus sp.]
MAEDPEIPRDSKAEASIRKAVEEFPDQLDIKTLKFGKPQLVIELITPEEFKTGIILPDKYRVESMEVTCLTIGNSKGKKYSLTINFNSSALDQMGGRSVENGCSPQYYKTYSELVKGIREALKFKCDW